MDSSEKKSLKVTNSRQFQILVNLMEENLQLARCQPASGLDKVTNENAWDVVAREVNTYGPPARTGNEWKKIWCDLKCRTKRKVYENNKIMNSCGEGSCRVVYLSELEQAVDRILDFSSMATNSQVIDESTKDSTFDSPLNDLENPYDVKTEPDVTISNIQISKGTKSIPSKRNRPTSHLRVLGKRKFDKTDRQFKLLQQQIQTQEKILEVMEMQATATKAMAEAASKQAEAMIKIADSAEKIAEAIQNAVKYLKRD